MVLGLVSKTVFLFSSENVIIVSAILKFAMFEKNQKEKNCGILTRRW